MEIQERDTPDMRGIETFACCEECGSEYRIKYDHPRSDVWDQEACRCNEEVAGWHEAMRKKYGVCPSISEDVDAYNFVRQEGMIDY